MRIVRPWAKFKIKKIEQFNKNFKILHFIKLINIMQKYEIHICNLKHDFNVKVNLEKSSNH